MVIDVNTSASPILRPRFRTDAITLKLIITLFVAVFFVAAYAYLRNGQRDLAEDIRRKEASYTALLRDLVAEKSRWNMCNTTPALSQKLAAHGFIATLPEASQVVYITPSHGRRGFATHRTGSLASR